MKLQSGSASSFLLISLFVACGLVSQGCSKSGAGKGSGQVIPVQAGLVSRQTIPLLQASVGTVQAVRSVAVKSQVDGVILAVNFKEGAPVNQGDLLITIDARPFQNALQIARADLANARAEADRADADADRYTRLRETQNVSIEVLAQYTTKRDTCRAQVIAKEAAVANAELQLSYTRIVAPISGLAGQLSLHEGALVKANDSTTSLVTINQVTPIEVAFAVPEKVLPLVRAAQAAGPVEVRILPQAGIAGPISGHLSFVDNTVDTTTGTLLLKAEFANADASLWPGQFVQVETALGADRDVVVAPTGTVQIGQRGTQAFVILQDRTVELRQVRAGRSTPTQTIILEGLREGEQVVTDGQLRLTPGAHVEVRTLEAVAAGAAAAGKQGRGEAAKPAKQ